MDRKHTEIKSWTEEHVCQSEEGLECAECDEPIHYSFKYARRVVRTLLESGKRTVLEVHREHTSPSCYELTPD